MNVFRSRGPDCPRRLICQSNRAIVFHGGHVIPSLVTYASNLVLSAAVLSEGKASQLLLAARVGRKGEKDCVREYPECDTVLK